MTILNNDLREQQIEVEDFDDLNDSVPPTLLTEEQHQKIMQYLLCRFNAANTPRMTRLQRYAKIDEFVSTWQLLDENDSIRQAREDATGKQQALPMNLPIAAAHIDDSVAFFTEIFAPVGGQFFAMPGKKNEIEAIKILADKMEEDMKQSSYYSAVTSTMNSICKYNIGGFHLHWEPSSRLSESDGNVLDSINPYNILYDQSVSDITKLHSDGEWVAIPEVKSRLWLIRKAEKEGLINLDKVIEQMSPSGGQKMNVDTYQKANYYKHPPSQTKLDNSGTDRPGAGMKESTVDWQGYGLGLKTENQESIDGHEVITCYAWIHPEQFELDRPEGDVGQETDGYLQLWRFVIVDSTWIVQAQALPGEKELPVYLARLKQDEMGEAARSLAEQIRPFQRFVSFLINTHVDGIRKNVWGKTVYDPAAIDPTNLKPGDTSGLIALKQGNRDVNTAIKEINTAPETFQNIQTAGEFMNLMKQLFPNQAMPSQIAGMDRAVTSQVSAVMQGAMRKMHMLVRALDSCLMLPIRMGMFRNIARFDPDKAQLQGVKPEQVAKLIASGLGQINREAAAEAVRSIIFALIQNPEGNQVFDVADLFRLWSLLQNIGTDLGEFVRQVAEPGQQVPTNGAPIPGTETVPGAQQAGVAAA